MIKHYTLLLTTTCLLAYNSSGQEVLFYEGFDNVEELFNHDWIKINRSNPLGEDTWGQGGYVGQTPASGEAGSYVHNSFMATTDAGVGVISDWLITPPVELMNGDIIGLQALSFVSSVYPDRVEVRISMNGGSDVGSDENSVGDFSTLVFSINPDLTTTGFPSLLDDEGNLLDSWTPFAGVVTGLSGATSCRIAVRYWVTDAGGAGNNSSSIGIDDLSATRGIVGLEEQATIQVGIYPNPAQELVRVDLPQQDGSFTVRILTATGQVALEQQLERSTTLDIRHLSSGVHLLEVRGQGTGAVAHTRLIKQ
jgi:hypothetical protein